MEMKDTLYSCFDSEEQEMQQMQKRAKSVKESSMNGLNVLRKNFQLLYNINLCGYPIDGGFKREFERLFGEEHCTFIDILLLNMNNLEKQLIKETLHEKDSKSALSVKGADASSGNTNSSGIVSNRGNANSLENDCSKTGNDQIFMNQSSTSGNESSKSRNDNSKSGNEFSERSNSGNDTDIKPFYGTQPMVEVPNIADYNVFVVDRQHSE
ncbi:hypothetical protein Tco_1293845 [Tanacetum coccineum]